MHMHTGIWQDTTMSPTVPEYSTNYVPELGNNLNVRFYKASHISTASSFIIGVFLAFF